ncbi:MAG: TetR family transcriptional regulator [Paracoccus denitrificans]|nr:MAG: TetR family transcriptional regulator [Paracoccus denitrificans]PZO83733.1 MAG: TetR family transcriptional regulator [Paracoccus denitrificans]
MPRETYHHGNLREALIEATTRLIEERGPMGWTLAEAARSAGVSPAAPYRHFLGREDLLLEVARIGYQRFASDLERAFDDGKPTVLAAYLRMAQAYLDFAIGQPGLYTAMFESGVDVSANPQLWSAGQRAHGVLTSATRALFAHMPEDSQPPTLMVANHMWAMAHGVVELFARARPGSRSPIEPHEMLESGILIYLRGLGRIS